MSTKNKHPINYTERVEEEVEEIDDVISTQLKNLSLNNPQSADISIDTTTEINIKEIKTSKRNKIWKFMDENNLIKAYPPSCFQKIPNFKGSGKAAEKLARLREFRQAKCIKINPSLAQMHLRFLTLRHRKLLLVPSPALGEAFMYMVDPKTLKQYWQFKRASSKAGSKEFGDELTLSSDVKIDLYVVASTVCARNGVRLGKGLGYAELEWAILHTFGMVDENTVVATTVHDCQVLTDDELPTSLMCCHDLPVDVIVTPTRIINVSKKLSKPSGGVFWDLITDKQLQAIPILKEIKPK